MNTSNTIEHLVEHLLQHFKIPYTSAFLLQHANSTADYGSLSSVADVLDLYQVPNLAAKIQPYQLQEIDFPAVAQIKTHDEENFIVLHHYSETEVTYYDLAKKQQTMPTKQFLEVWEGIVLLLAPDENAQEPHYEQNRQEAKRKKRNRLIGQGLLINLALFMIFATGYWLSMALLITSTIGLMASIVLFMNQLGKTNTLIGKLCNINKATSCEEITQSPQSTFLGWLSWAEVGLIYFAGVLLSTLFFSFISTFAHHFQWLAIVSLLSIPYIVFSVFYQGVVAKKWCTLCLIVQAVLLFNVLWFIPLFDQILVIRFSVETLAIYGVAFILPLATWLSVRDRLLHPTDTRLRVSQLQKVKHREIFDALMAQQATYKITPLPYDIHLGNPMASIQILMVSNPFCPPCVIAHQQLAQLLKYFGEEVNITIRFIPNTYAPQDEVNLIIRHLMALRNTPTIAHALHDWYIIKDYKIWKKTYPANTLVGPEALLPYSKWVEEAKVDATPTIFINGKKLHEEYQAEHLKYHLRSLIEQHEQPVNA